MAVALVSHRVCNTGSVLSDRGTKLACYLSPNHPSLEAAVKMRVSIVLVLLLSAMLVVHTEAGWLKKLASGVKKAVTKVASFVKNSPLRLLGKRSVGRPHPYPTEDRMGRPAEEGDGQTEQIMEELELACPTFGINPDRGLNKEVLDDAFEESDDNGDGELDEKELYFLESTVEVYEQCVVMLAAKKK